MLPKMSSYIRRTREFLERIAESQTLALVYHGDVDGCCSAVLMHLAIQTKLGRKPDHLHWIGTHDLSFRKTPGYLGKIRPSHIIFVDLNIESQPDIIARIEREIGSRILIFDDHVADYEPDSASVVYLNPRQFNDVHPVPPACVYALRVQQTFSPTDASWLAGIGLIGEGLADNYPEFMNTLPERTVLSQISRLINASYLRDEETGNEVLKTLLKAAVDSGPSGIIEREIEGVDKLYSIREAVDATVDRSVGAFDKHAQKWTFGSFSFYAYEVLSGYRVLHFVASTVYRQRQNVVVLTHQLYEEKRVVEIRSSVSGLNLPTLLGEALQDVPHYNFGGHPSAAGASMPPQSFPVFLERLVHILEEQT